MVTAMKPVHAGSDRGLTSAQPDQAHAKHLHYAVLMTVHNRREKTLEALRRVSKQTLLDSHRLTIYLVDAGSCDGTSSAVQKEFPEVQIIVESASLFWNGGMRRAFAAASTKYFDGHFWLNDDTMLHGDACQRLLDCADAWERKHGHAIVAGSVMDPTTHEHAYGGFMLLKRRARVTLIPVTPDPLVATRCDSMNGNFVYIPKFISAALGNLEETFTHQLGDIDYGLRARKSGFDVIVAPDYLGTCQPNSIAGTWRDRYIPFRERWRNLISPKGSPPREWLLFIRRHYGLRWPLYAVSPYVKTLLTSMPLARKQ